MPTPQNGQTQTIRPQQPKNSLSVFVHVMAFALKELKIKKISWEKKYPTVTTNIISSSIYFFNTMLG